MTHLKLDHLRYIRNQRYRRRMNARLRRLVAEETGLARLTIEHEHDQRCCCREPWSATYRRLIGELHADGESVLGIALAASPEEQDAALQRALREAAWQVVTKVALDCVPPVRMAVMRSVAAGGLSTTELALLLDYPLSTVRRAAEDLTAHGVLSRAKRNEKEGAADIWNQSPWTRTRWQAIPELSVDTGEGKEEKDCAQHSPTDFSGTAAKPAASQPVLTLVEPGAIDALTDADYPLDLAEVDPEPADVAGKLTAIYRRGDREVDR